MFLRYLANTVENNTGVLSTGEELLIARTRTHTHAHARTRTHAHTHTQTKTYKKTNKTKRIVHKIFLPFSKVELRCSIAFSDSVIDKQ